MSAPSGGTAPRPALERIPRAAPLPSRWGGRRTQRRPFLLLQAINRKRRSDFFFGSFPRFYVCSHICVCMSCLCHTDSGLVYAEMLLSVWPSCFKSRLSLGFSSRVVCEYWWSMCREAPQVYRAPEDKKHLVNPNE